ncbi:DUF1659 domain-containing protein [Candidatus Contubernalis alkaliaceticus]|uniref:DUF1659 domain-containing protein n=1 Tax=Candidatus Contubernalis alkaliaceticus TaxID=338645 RepID=UPI001F4BD9B8|nr:DUF1659 domain-containing protein [Candidatus Contubernalis alkalaceticus]UNC90762.1 DUF1659 domain-containing protein [Candidatus Contubernalis alkalaceticus]
MPLQVLPGYSRIQLRLQVGTVESPAYRTRTYSNVKHDSSDQDVYDVAFALGNLQQYDVDSIIRINENQLTAS